MNTRWNWGHSIAAVYIVFAASTAGFVVFAMDQRVDLVSTDYYEQSIALDSRREAEANARALGAALSMTEQADAHTITVHWPAAAVVDASGTVTLYRAADATADRRLPLHADANGAMTIALAGLAPGPWKLQLEWTSGGRMFYAERDLTIAGSGR